MTVRIVPLPLSISNAYLLLGDRPVLVDAGKPGEEEKLLHSLRQHGIAPSDLSLVVLTHGHTDHAGSVMLSLAPGCRIAIGADDAGCLNAASTNSYRLPDSPDGSCGLSFPPHDIAGASPQVLVRESLRLDAYGIESRWCRFPVTPAALRRAARRRRRHRR